MIGQTIRAKDGSTYTVTEFIGAGSQASIYKAMSASNRLVVFKQFNHVGSVEFQRARELMGLGLPSTLPVGLPKALVSDGNVEGYITEHIEGMTLEKVIAAGQLDYFAGFKIIAMLWVALAELHAVGVSLIHGDIQAGNVMVTKSGRVLFIDPDNFVHPRVATAPPCVGEITVIAPELRKALNQGYSAAPYISKASDVYAANALTYLLLTGEDDSYGAQTPKEFDERRLSGAWNGDRFGKAKCNGGLAPKMLPLQLESLIRQAWSGEPHLRPGAAEFARVCAQIISNGELIVCEHCQQPVFVDASKTECPHCQNALPTPVLMLPNGRHLVIGSSYMVLGRNELGGDASISSKHAIVGRWGPLLRFIDRSSHGSLRDRGNGKWEQITKSLPTIIHPGELLKLGNTRIQVGRI